MEDVLYLRGIVSPSGSRCLYGGEDDIFFFFFYEGVKRLVPLDTTRETAGNTQT